MLDECMNEGEWVLIVLNNKNSFDFMTDIKK